MKRSILLVAGCCLLASLAVQAHEPPGRRPDRVERVVPMRDYGGGYWDFRFGWGSEPMLTDSEYEFDDGTTADYEWEWEAPGGSLEFNAAHRFGARGPSSGYVTFGAFLRGFEGPDDPDSGTEVSVGGGGVQVGGGWSYRPNARYSLEVGPRLGIGTASATEEFNGGELESDTGTYARFDVGAANLFNFGTLQFGVTVGIASWAASVPYDPQTVNTFSGPVAFPAFDATYSGAGGYLNLSLGFR